MTTDGMFRLSDLTDEDLARVRRDYQRAIEDGARDTRGFPQAIEAVRVQQLARFRLRMRYGAVDNHLGTDVYDRWYRLGEAPTYRLAAHIDHSRWQLGQSNVLTWRA